MVEGIGECWKLRQREAGGVRRCKNGRRLGGSRTAGGAGAAAGTHSPQPASGQPTLGSEPPRKPVNCPEEVGWPRAESRDPGAPRPCLASCPQFRLRSRLRSLAVELHLQPGPRGRYRDSSSQDLLPHFPWTEAAADQTSRAVLDLRPFRLESARVPRPLGAQPGSARGLYDRSAENRERPRTMTRLAGRKPGDICEERNRKNP